MKFVFDTNVLISALLRSHSVPAKALDCAEGIGTILYSTQVLEELQQVLTRPKFQPYISPDKVTGFIARIEQSWDLIHILTEVVLCRDPDDDRFLSLALNGGAIALITGNRALLDLHPFGDTAIITPADFIDRFNTDPHAPD